MRHRGTPEPLGTGLEIVRRNTLRRPWLARPSPHVRTNLSRLGVAADIAEMVLGHRLTGMRKVYDRHDYLAEKRAALELWAMELKSILNRKDS